MPQTIIVVIIIAVAAIYVALRLRPSRLKSENPCDKCSGCSLGSGKEFTTRVEESGPGSCCDRTRDPEGCPHSGQGAPEIKGES